MVWGENLPSGRERAIETLIDMEPQGSICRAAPVLVSSIFFQCSRKSTSRDVDRTKQPKFGCKRDAATKNRLSAYSQLSVFFCNMAIGGVSAASTSSATKFSNKVSFSRANIRVVEI